MNTIRISNFGPIRDSGEILVNKVTVFLGNQGSGKSTVAKLISSFLWMEKVLFRGDYQAKWFERKGRFRSQLLAYHRLENYIRRNGEDNSHIQYFGDFCNIEYQKGTLKVETKHEPYVLPQILYVPAERNFIAYVRTPKELKLSSESLKTFIGDFTTAKESIKYELRLPLNNSSLEYDRLNDTLNLRGRDYKIRLSDAASGFQSFVPLYLVSHYLSSSLYQDTGVKHEGMSSEELRRFQKEVEELYRSTELSDEQRRAALAVLSKKFKKSAFINIVEEPEQNLYPTSQCRLLFSLLGFNNQIDANKLIFTTHSPYLVNALSLAIKGEAVNDKIRQLGNATSDSLKSRLANIVPLEALTRARDVSIYQLDEKGGTVFPLSSPYGVPSDDNYLNALLGEGNDAFGGLMDIEEEL